MDVIAKDYVAGVIYLVLNGLGLCGQWVLLTTLAVRWARFASLPFYVLVIGLAVGDSTFLLTNLLAAVPECFSSPHHFYVSRSVKVALGWGNTFGFYCLFAFTCLIALNRAGTFLCHRLNERVFNEHNMPAIFATFVTLSAAGASGIIAVGCPKVHHSSPFYWKYDCGPRNETGWPAAVWCGVQSSAGRSVPWLLLIGYAAVFVYLRCERTQASRQNAVRTKAERSLLLQGCVISVMLAAHTTTFWRIGDIQTALGYWGTVLGQCVGALNCSINPVIYMTFNSLLREQVVQVVCRTESDNRISPTRNLFLVETKNVTYPSDGYRHKEKNYVFIC